MATDSDFGDHSFDNEFVNFLNLSFPSFSNRVFFPLFLINRKKGHYRHIIFLFFTLLSFSSNPIYCVSKESANAIPLTGFGLRLPC